MIEEPRTALRELKDLSQADDDLLKQLTQQRRRRDLERRFQELADADRDELPSLSDV